MRLLNIIRGGENKKMDKGLFGPEETRTMSWSKGRIFPPKFETISSFLEKDISLKLELKNKKGVIL